MESSHQRNFVARRAVLVSGLPVPLFDRLREDLDDARIVEPYCVQDRNLVFESIQRELKDLLNTRLPPRQHLSDSTQPASLPQTVIDYGLPGFCLPNGDSMDSAVLARIVAGKIAAFEPRMQNPSVTLRANPDNPSGMLGTISGEVRLDQASYMVSFQMNSSSSREEIEISLAETQEQIA
jgi:type VI secretion system lysozyme-like protein